jgi:hypothetical protein
MLLKRSLRVVGLLVLVAIARGVVGLGGQFYHHKSESDVAHMTPEQQVDEYCNEYVRHGLGHSDYSDLIKKVYLPPRNQSRGSLSRDREPI